MEIRFEMNEGIKTKFLSSLENENERRSLAFEKWQGLGNDFIIVEGVKLAPELVIKLCDRNFGIGADGIFCPAPAQKGGDIAWDFYNADGSTAQMCGNGMRCFAKYVFEKGLVKERKFSVETLAGVVIPEILSDEQGGKVRVDMGAPILEAAKIPVNIDTPQDFTVEGFSATAVSMGNPHCVIFLEDDKGGNTRAQAVEKGIRIELSPIFPEKTNVEFAKVISRSEIQVDVWERGCGITLACGTGACASVVAGVLKGLLDSKVRVNLPGGALEVEYAGADANVYMTGDAKKVFEGVIEV